MMRKRNLLGAAGGNENLMKRSFEVYEKGCFVK